jgi:hypothetical protein
MTAEVIVIPIEQYPGLLTGLIVLSRARKKLIRFRNRILGCSEGHVFLRLVFSEHYVEYPDFSTGLDKGIDYGNLNIACSVICDAVV